MPTNRDLLPSGKIKDLHMTVKLANNQIRQRREEKGLGVAEAANACGVSYGTWIKLESMRARPTMRVFSGKPQKGLPRVCVGEEWSGAAHKIAKFFAVTPGDLFPDAVMAIRKSRIEMRVTAEQVAALASDGVAPPGRRLEADEARSALEAAIADLPPRSAKVIRMRFGLDDGEAKTLEDAGAAIGVSRTRAMQIEERALRDMRKHRALREAASP